MIQVRVGNSQVGFSDEFLGLSAMSIVKESCGPYLAVKEKGKLNEGLHIHVFIMLDGKVQAFRKRLLKAIPGLKGRGNYSIIPNIDGQPVLPNVHEIWKTYACKGERRGEMPNVLYNTMLTQENIIERHHKYWDMQTNLKPVPEEPKESDVVHIVKERRKTVCEKVADRLHERNPEMKWTLSSDHRRMVFRAVMRHLGHLGKVLDVNIVKRMCYGVHNLLSHDECCDDIWFQMTGETF